jgi:hypothetical protein
VGNAGDELPYRCHLVILDDLGLEQALFGDVFDEHDNRAWLNAR